MQFIPGSNRRGQMTHTYGHFDLERPVKSESSAN
jgi:hypothetical protein